MGVFQNVIGVMTALSCLLCLLGMLLPKRRSPPLSLLVSLLVVLAVLSPLQKGGSLLDVSWEELEQELEAQQWEMDAQDQILKLSQRQLEENIKTLCQTQLGQEPQQVEVTLTGEGEKIIIGHITLVGIEDSQALRQLLQENYQPQEVVVEET